MYGDRASPFGARPLEPAPRGQLDLLRRIFTCRDTCPERIELDARVRGVHEADEREVGADRAHPSSLGARLTGSMLSRRSMSASASAIWGSFGDAARQSR